MPPERRTLRRPDRPGGESPSTKEGAPPSPSMADDPAGPNQGEQSSLWKYVREYFGARTLKEGAAERENTFKKGVMERLAEIPSDDIEKGHSTYEFPNPITGHKGAVYTGVTRQKRVSQALDEEKTLALVKAKKLEAKCLETITILNEDKVLAANFNGEITDEELDACYNTSETYALVPIKEK